MAIAETKGLDGEARRALDTAMTAGADSARVWLSQARHYALRLKNDDVELLQESQRKSAALTLYCGGRYGVFSTSDLRPDALRDFAARAVEMVRLNDPDPARGLPDPAYTAPVPDVALELTDRELVERPKKEQSRALLDAAVAGARAVSPEVFHVEASYGERHMRSVLLTSDGFHGSEEATLVSLGAAAYVKDRDSRKQTGYDQRQWCYWADREPPEAIGATAAQRALDMRGSAPAKTGTYPVVIVNYWGDYFTGLLLRALSGAAVYRGMSCLADKLGEAVASPALTIKDDPFVPRSMGSRHFDEEGMVARPLIVVEKGVLRSFYFDSYWARKKGVPPTTGQSSNLVFAPGTRSGDEMVAGLERGIFITGFLGGNFNPTTGDFSAGINGFLVEDGKRVQPVTEMNLAGNLLDVLPKLEELGNDPYPFMNIRSPAMRFAPLMVSGE